MTLQPTAADLSGAKRLAELRRKHPRFVYEGYQGMPDGENRNAQLLKFLFRLESEDAHPIEFCPETVIESVDWEGWRKVPLALLENSFFHIGLVEMLSYWKAACSSEIVVELPDDVPISSLDEEQTAWWLDLLRHGMGEYFYVNQIDWRAPDFVRILSSPSDEKEDILRYGHQVYEASLAQATSGGPSSSAPPRTLVLTSGGKDSVVTIELLRQAGEPFNCLLLNPTPAALAIAKQAGCEKPIIVRRTIDPRLLELNAAGYLNGHTPFSALLAFLGSAVATLLGYKRVIVSNERSAEEPGVEFLGHPINHQYSKTYEFETKFRDYSAKYLLPQVEYFSMLRPLYELQIARAFARYPQYFSLFRSCNRGMKTNSWCGQCPKCLFVYTVLYPFVERAQVTGIFGKDLFEWDGSEEVLRTLLGMDRTKPFECVGTREETLAAIHLCVEKYKSQGITLPTALANIERTVLASRSDLPALAQRILSSWSDQHHLPADLASVIRAAGPATSV